MGKFMINCKQASHYASQSLDCKQTFFTRFKLKLHNLMCVWCDRFASQMQTIRNLMQSASQKLNEHPGYKTPPLPDDIKQKIKKRLEEHQRSL